MPQPNPITVLLVSEQAEDIKQISIVLRAYYPGCRVEAVYTAEEGLEWATKENWQLIILDEHLSSRSGLTLLPDLRSRSPRSGIFILMSHSEDRSAMQMMHAGADYCLFKRSPAFMAELPIVANTVLEKRRLRAQLDLASQRHHSLTEISSDLIYELDTQGQFRHVSPAVSSLLGYHPQELIGVHYSKIVYSSDLAQAEWRFNERRTGSRATHRLRLRLAGKQRSTKHQALITCEVSATGLYTSERQFLGTIGLVRAVPQSAGEVKPPEAAPPPKSEPLTDPLTAIAAVKETPTPVALTQLLEEILSARAENFQTQGILVETRFLREIQPVPGQAGHLRQILEALFDKAKELLRGSGEGKRLRVSTRQLEPTSMQPALIEVALTAEGSDTLKDLPGKNTVLIVHLLPSRVASVLEALGGSLHSDFLPGGGVCLRLQLPVWEKERQTEYLSSPERRRWPRVEIQAEVSFTMQGHSWKGRADNINQGGLYLVFDSKVPLFEHQPVQISLITEVATLRIPSTITGVREMVTAGYGSSINPARGFSIAFGPLGDIEGKVLESLLTGLSEQALFLKIEASLTSQDTPQDTPSDVPSHSNLFEAPETEEVTWTDQRLAIRVKVAIPAQIETADTVSPFLQREAHITNLSISGAGLTMEEPVPLKGRQLLLRFTPPSPLIPTPQEQNGLTRECGVRGEVVWQHSHGTERLGLRFLPTIDDSRRRVADLVGNLLGSPTRVDEGSWPSRITSDWLEIQNPKGHRITLYYDHPHDSSQEPLLPGSPVVIVSPGYGETKKESIALSYYLAINGFHALRYDHTDHVGESGGNIANTSLTTMKEDLLAVLDHTERTWPASSVAIVASNLSGRAALKLVSQDRRAKLLVLLNAVLDVQATLFAAHQEDVGMNRHGMRAGLVNLLGLNIDADRWLADALNQEFADLQSTLSDIQHITTPVIVFAWEQDPWVSLTSVKEVQVKLGVNLKYFHLIPEAFHRLHENPHTAKAVFSQLTIHCVEHFFPLLPQRNIAEPARREIVLRTRLEQERARARHLMAKSEALAFWQEYLAHSRHIANSPDYWHLMALIDSLGGSPQGQERILDAGCGNGSFGLFLMMTQAYRRRNAADPRFLPPQYVGIDFVPNALGQAKHDLAILSSRLSADPILHTSLSLADLNTPLPFRDNQFNRVVCNLVISYLHDPLFTLREFIRVLCPHGKLILTNLKPHANLWEICRNFAEIAKQPEELAAAKELLYNAGNIKAGERNGLFRFFTKQELAMLLASSGAVCPRIYSTFANQAFIAVAEKPGMASAY